MLRRVIAGLRRQDWAPVAIELVVVVVGVFIGVQASNWNEERETDRKAAVFTERLKADLREEAWGYQLIVTYHEEVVANAKRAIDALTGSAPLSDEALLVNAYRATQYFGNIRRRATYDELTSTGEIGLIRDVALRELAMHTYTVEMFDDIVREGKQSPYRELFRRSIPYEVQHALGAACGDKVVRPGDYAAIAHSLDYPCSTGLTPKAIATSASVLRNGAEFVPLLRQRMADVETNLANLTLYYKQDIWEPLQKLAPTKP
jgi:hypothetical protein